MLLMPSIIICPTDIAWHGTDYETIFACDSLSVHTLKSTFLVNFHAKWHRRKNPKMSSSEVNIGPPYLIGYYAPKTA